MSPKQETSSGVAVIVVPTDALFASGIDTLQDELRAVSRENKQVVLDLRQVQFVDSAGCGALLHLHKDLKARGGRLALSNLTPPVQSLFELTRMSELIAVHPTRQDAVAALVA